MSVKFVFEKSCKNVWKYRVENATNIPGYNTLYVPKKDGEPPATLTVTLN